MNIDFSNDASFSWYVVLLIFSGLVMLVMSGFGSHAQSAGMRVLNLIVGLGFLGYGVYLGFIFKGGSYLIFFKAFILPIVLVINFFRSLATRRNGSAAVQR